MRNKIINQAHHLAESVFTRVILFSVTDIGICLAIGYIIDHPLAWAIILSGSIPLIPILGMIYLSFKLPSLVESQVKREIDQNIEPLVRERLPNDIEYASCQQLRDELQKRSPCVIIFSDERTKMVHVHDQFTEQACERKLRVLFGMVHNWTVVVMRAASERGIRLY